MPSVTEVSRSHLQLAPLTCLITIDGCLFVTPPETRDGRVTSGLKFLFVRGGGESPAPGRRASAQRESQLHLGARAPSSAHPSTSIRFHRGAPGRARDDCLTRSA